MCYHLASRTGYIGLMEKIMAKKKTIAMLIRQELKKRKMTIEQLSKEMSVPRNTIDRHLAGDRIPSAEALSRYCHVLDIDAADALATILRAKKQLKR